MNSQQEEPLITKNHLTPHSRYPSRKTFMLISILAFLLLDIGLVIFIVNHTKQTPSSLVQKQTAYQTSNIPTEFPTPTLSPIQTDWQLHTLPSDSNLSQPVQKENLIFAYKTGTRVEVFKKNLVDGSQSSVLTYSESQTADKKQQNFYTSLPASIAFFPPKQLLAYTSTKGLQLYSLQTNTSQLLIFQKPSKIAGSVPSWSVANVVAYSLNLPGWSQDGNYITLVEGEYEGSNYGIYNLTNNSFSTINTWDAIKPLVTSHGLFLIPHSYNGGGGLSIGSLSNPTKGSDANPTSLTNLARIFHKGSTSFDDAVFSPDGQSVYFLYADKGSHVSNTLGVATIDGSNFHILRSGNPLSSLMVNPDGTTVSFFEQGANKQWILSSYSLHTNTITSRIELPYSDNLWQSIGWTEEGYITLIGAKKFLLVDLGNRKIMYQMSNENDYATFAGFTN